MGTVLSGCGISCLTCVAAETEEPWAQIGARQGPFLFFFPLRCSRQRRNKVKVVRISLLKRDGKPAGYKSDFVFAWAHLELSKPKISVSMYSSRTWHNLKKSTVYHSNIKHWCKNSLFFGNNHFLLFLNRTSLN